MFRTVTSRAQARSSRSGLSSSTTKSFAHTVSSQPPATSYLHASCSSSSSSSSSTVASLHTPRRQLQSARRQQRHQITTSNLSQPRRSPLTTSSSSPSTTTFAIAPPTTSSSSSSSSYTSSPIPRHQGQRQQQGPQRRFFSSSLSSQSDQHTPSTGAPAEITPDQYHQLADAYIEALLEELEMMQEERAEVDVEYSAGVLKLVFPPAGTYVINKQPPNKQIWLSSPVSGPKRYDWVLMEEGDGGEEGQEWRQGNWVYLRDGSTLNELLSEELGVETEGLGKDVD